MLFTWCQGSHIGASIPQRMEFYFKATFSFQLALDKLGWSWNERKSWFLMCLWHHRGRNMVHAANKGKRSSINGIAMAERAALNNLRKRTTSFPGSLFQRLKEAEKRDPGNEVGKRRWRQRSEYTIFVRVLRHPLLSYTNLSFVGVKKKKNTWPLIVLEKTTNRNWKFYWKHIIFLFQLNDLSNTDMKKSLPLTLLAMILFCNQSGVLFKSKRQVLNSFLCADLILECALHDV